MTIFKQAINFIKETEAALTQTQKLSFALMHLIFLNIFLQRMFQHQFHLQFPASNDKNITNLATQQQNQQRVSCKDSFQRYSEQITEQ